MGTPGIPPSDLCTEPNRLQYEQAQVFHLQRERFVPRLETRQSHFLWQSAVHTASFKYLLSAAVVSETQKQELPVALATTPCPSSDQVLLYGQQRQRERKHFFWLGRLRQGHRRQKREEEKEP